MDGKYDISRNKKPYYADNLHEIGFVVEVGGGFEPP